jgi:hypothetical protein
MFDVAYGDAVGGLVLAGATPLRFSLLERQVTDEFQITTTTEI